ncbi:MAG: DNA polymerase III subunit delta [Dorea sp.]|jgi:DNA polymerase III delta subunit|nr:DNA polymerase III subunit delta [Dorea sp.]
MKSLNEDIRSGQFKNVYLLYGEEAYLKKQYKDRMTKAMLPDGDTMNYAYYEGKGINPSELIDLAETLPFFAERRLIVVENSNFFKNAAPELADYMKTIPETTCFLFVENEVDKRGKLYKTVKEKGRIVEMGRQDEKTLLYWIAGNVRKEGRQIKESTARYLVSKTGTDMENLEKELEKLFSYTLPEASLSASDGADHLEGRDKEASENIEITVKDIDAVCTTQISNKIFDMIEAVAAKHQKKALNYYYDLLALKEPPMRILYLLARQFRILLQVKDLLDRGNDKAQIAKAAKLHPFVAGKYMQQCRTFTSAELKGIMEEAANTEELVKTGRLNDVMSVEIFIVKFSA